MIALGGVAVVAAIAALTVRTAPPQREKPKAATSRTQLPDTLRAVTLYGPTSYFSYRDEAMGADYEMLSRFAGDHKMALELMVASGVPEMLEMLRKGEVDMIAYEVPRIAEYRKDVAFCGKNRVTHQVLVQPKGDSITDVTSLIGKTLYVEKDSKYQYRLMNLNDELGGGIGIEAVTTDTLETADLLVMVNNGELPLTVTDSDMANACASMLRNIDASLPVSMDQYASWVVAKNDTLLANTLDRWTKSVGYAAADQDVNEKYFRHLIESAVADSEFQNGEGASASGSHTTTGAQVRPDGSISDFDGLFRKYAAEIGWDWRELAAIGYVESGFKPHVVSWAGARGLMQIMPSTARTWGVADRIDNPDANVYAAAQTLAKLDKSLAKRIADPEERRKFVIASYNSGLGHILDAIELAKKYGRNPTVWYGNVRDMALLKMKPQYYNDPVVKHGYFRGQETVDFVDRVRAAYARFRQSSP